MAPKEFSQFVYVYFKQIYYFVHSSKFNLESETEYSLLIFCF